MQGQNDIRLGENDIICVLLFVWSWFTNRGLLYISTSVWLLHTPNANQNIQQKS